MLRCRASALGREANKRAECGDHYQAIEIYSQAIALYPLDYRFYANRAFCYLNAELYHLALTDTQEAIRLEPRHHVCYLYRARALAGMAEYSRAELAFKQALLLINDTDGHCLDSRVDNEMIELRYQALHDIGFDKQTSAAAARQYPSIRAAIDGLLSERVFKSDIKSVGGEGDGWTADIALKNSINMLNSPQVVAKPNNKVIIIDGGDSDGTGGRKREVKYADKARDWAKQSAADQQSQQISSQKPQQQQPSAQDIPVIDNNKTESGLAKIDRKPTNIWGYHGLRVRNINSAHKKSITKRFGAYGVVRRVEPVAKSKSSVWIYYDNPVSPVEAIAGLQNTCHTDLNHYESGRVVPLRMFFAPTDQQTELRFSRPKQPLDPKGECYYWRTTTCLLADRCSFSHIPANRQIDAQVWMKDRDGKPI